MTKQTIKLSGDRHIIIETDGKGGGSMTIVGSAGALRDACPNCGEVDCERTCPAQAERQDSDREEVKEERLLFNAAIGGMESFLLALACAGVNVTTKQFTTALETTLDSIGNHYS